MKAYQVEELSREVEKLRALNSQEQSMLDGYKEHPEAYFLIMVRAIDKRKALVSKKIKALKERLAVQSAVQ